MYQKIQRERIPISNANNQWDAFHYATDLESGREQGYVHFWRDQGRSQVAGKSVNINSVYCNLWFFEVSYSIDRQTYHCTNTKRGFTKCPYWSLHFILNFVLTVNGNPSIAKILKSQYIKHYRYVGSSATHSIGSMALVRNSDVRYIRNTDVTVAIPDSTKSVKIKISWFLLFQIVIRWTFQIFCSFRSLDNYWTQFNKHLT